MTHDTEIETIVMSAIHQKDGRFLADLFIDTFDAAGIVPLYGSRRAFSKIAYNPERLRRALPKGEVYFSRKPGTQMVGRLLGGSAIAQGFVYLSIRNDGSDEFVEKVWGLCTEMVRGVEPTFGRINVISPKLKIMDVRSRLNPTQLRTLGLSYPSQRTLFGPMLTGLLKDELPDIGIVTPLGTCTQVDLLPTPWAQPPDTLIAAQEQATAVLKSTGLLIQKVDRKMQNLWAPAPKWLTLPAVPYQSADEAQIAQPPRPAIAVQRWEAVEDGVTHYVMLTPAQREVLVGSHSGSGHSDNARAESYEAFIMRRRFHKQIADLFGEAMLNALVAKVGSQL